MSGGHTFGTSDEGDVHLFQTPDGGDVEIHDGVVHLTATLRVSVYLSLFGGNVEDAGTTATKHLGYWANFLEPEERFQYVSRTQNLLQNITAIPANLRKIEQAADRDLSWLLTDNVASSVTVSASLIDVGKVKIIVDVVANGVESRFTFTENWKALT